MEKSGLYLDKIEVECMRELQSIGIYKGPTFPLHTHSVWDIVYYFEGDVELRTGDQTYLCPAGSLLFLPPFTPHEDFCQKEYSCYFFSVKNFDFPISDLTIIRDSSCRPIQNIVSQVFDLHHLRETRWQPVIESLFETLNHYAIAMISQSSQHPLVEAFISIMVNNINNDLFCMQTAISKLPVSSDHFRVVFKKETGKTPIRYLTDLRIKNAMDLLLTRYRHNQITIEAVANLCGFADSYYFSRVFHKVTGYSPLQWLKTML
jgi:AraC-like DNA-binding protein